jgi:Fe-S oxidoreductase
VASLSYEDKFMVGFTSSLLERDIQREFFRLLASFGVEVVIMTNELEV